MKVGSVGGFTQPTSFLVGASLLVGASARPRLGRAGALPGTRACAELLDHLAIECGNVLGLAARHQSVVDDDFLVHPMRARVREVRLE